jgi:uncharacterized protein with PQ loop repeat
MIFLATSLPAHCEPQGAFLTWLSSTFDTCVPTPLALTTTFLGSLSFLAWLFAQLPQIYKNYKAQSTSGLSIYFLVEWLLGDTTNLVGAILTKQASWQILVASYYTFVDCIMCAQYVYYTLYKTKRRTHLGTQGAHASLDGASNGRPLTASVEVGSKPRDVPFNAFSLPSWARSPREKGTPGSSRTITRSGNGSLPAASPRTVLMLATLLAVLGQASPVPSNLRTLDAPAESNGELVGRVVSWASTLLYLGSRLPQILKNARRKSTSGLSLSLFVAAFFGNLFYSTSLLTNPLAWGSYPPYGHRGWADEEGSDRATWVLLALPFWLGAAGVLALDLTIGIQFAMYGDGPQRPKLVPTEDVRGRGHWRRVSGFMRGWVPSPSPSLRAPRVDEDERPLLADTRTSRGGYGGAQ